MERLFYLLMTRYVRALDIADTLYIKQRDIPTRFKNQRPGSDWFTAFRRRHNPSIKKPQSIEHIRYDQSNPWVVYEYFEKLNQIINDYNLTGKLAIGQKCKRKTNASGRENTSVLLGIAADGTLMPPLCVFKRKRNGKLDKRMCYPNCSISHGAWLDGNECPSRNVIPVTGFHRGELARYKKNLLCRDNGRPSITISDKTISLVHQLVIFANIETDSDPTSLVQHPSTSVDAETHPQPTPVVDHPIENHTQPTPVVDHRIENHTQPTPVVDHPTTSSTADMTEDRELANTENSNKKSFEEMLLDIFRKESKPQKEVKRRRIVQNCEIITTEEYLKKKEQEEREKTNKAIQKSKTAAKKRLKEN
ncbi:hypothetical protein QE152_g19758 [Popillia japonica]|uniref:HTH CENPB-type domain-containing protein n=1 Tax=Popillia japonica TaxID=7064 RepID=A0AAW1KN33_POPJA